MMEERRKETVGGLGGEDENYLFGLGFGKIILLIRLSNTLVPNQEKIMSRLYIATLLI